MDTSPIEFPGRRRRLRGRALAAGVGALAALAALAGCGTNAEIREWSVDPIPTGPATAPDPTEVPSRDEALERAGAEALERKRTARAVEQEFIALLETDRTAAKRRAARRVRDAYLSLARATDDYRAQLRAVLGPAASQNLLEPFKKQARGLRLVAKGLDDYREGLRTGSSALARQGLRKMTRGEALMRRAESDLAGVTGPAGGTPGRAF